MILCYGLVKIIVLSGINIGMLLEPLLIKMVVNYLKMYLLPHLTFQDIDTLVHDHHL